MTRKVATVADPTKRGTSLVPRLILIVAVGLAIVSTLLNILAVVIRAPSEEKVAALVIIVLAWPLFCCVGYGMCRVALWILARPDYFALGPFKSFQIWFATHVGVPMVYLMLLIAPAWMTIIALLVLLGLSEELKMLLEESR